MAVRYDVEGQVATITLNRPECLNAYDVAMRDALDAALAAATDDPGVRVVVLRGAGRAFCSGGDLREFGTAPSPLAARGARFARDVPGRLARFPKPLVAAVHGDAVGGGLEMALLADFCVAAADARFRLPEAGLGMIPGVGGTQTLPRAIGLGHAADVALSRRWVGADEARTLGIATRVVPPEALATEVDRLAAAVAALAPSLVAAARRAIHDGLDGTLGHGLALEGLLAATNAARAPEAT